MAEKIPESQRKRSPNFPYASVRECVELVKKLSNVVGTTKVPLVIAFGHMGLNPKSSTTDRIRASLSSYGLTTEEYVNKEKYIRLTALSKRIAIETRQNTLLAAYQEAALSDPMVKKIWSGDWKRGLPNDDATIISALRVEYNFQEDAAKRFVNVLKDNYRFCELAKFYEPPNGKDDEPISLDGSADNNVVDFKPRKPMQENVLGNLTQYPIPLDGGRFAYIALPSTVTAGDAQYIPDFVGLILKKINKSKEDDDRGQSTENDQ